MLPRSGGDLPVTRRRDPGVTAMTYVLAVGERIHSSWSLRGWLMFARFGIPVRVVTAPLYSPDFERVLADFAPARLVPALRIEGEGLVVWDTLAIAETLAERHPDRGLWPADPTRRAVARSIVAEMHAGFGALREACPMNLRRAYAGFVPSAEVLADLARIEALWSFAREAAGDGPWLFGDYSIADAFFAPVAARIAGYGLPVGSEAAGYVAAHLGEEAFRAWRAAGLAEQRVLTNYDLDLPAAPWPGPG